jgi:hypothetical protein
VCFAKVKEEPAQRAGDTQQNARALHSGDYPTPFPKMYTINHRAQAIGTRFFYGRCQSKRSVF